MSIIEDMLLQTAVYWPPGSETSGGADFDEYGAPQYATAVEVDCRWEDTAEEFVGPNAERELSRAKVYVDRDLKVRGVLFLGGLAEVTDLNDPKANENAWEIRRFDKLPDIDAEEFLRTAFL